MNTDAKLAGGTGWGGWEDLTVRERAELYAAGALTPAETELFETHVRDRDPEYLAALEEVRPVMEHLLNAAPPVTPPAAIRAALIARLEVGAQQVQPPAEEAATHADDPFADEDHDEEAVHTTSGAGGITVLRAANARWRRTGLRGVRYRTLLADRRANRRTIMLDMAPGSALPDHSHAGIEEVFMISGDLAIAGQVLNAGDYIRVERGAQHGVPRTTNGCVCIVISDYVPFPLTSLVGFVWTAFKALFRR